MNIARIEKNISDVIAEEQIKLGYRSESIRLYYPLQSLNRFLGTSWTADEMQMALEQKFMQEQDRQKAAKEEGAKSCILPGDLKVSHKNERFCLWIPAETVDAVHARMEEHGFLRTFIRTIEKHGCTIEELRAVFRKYSEHVHFERTEHGEFDYLLYFIDGVPDEFRYCITDEGCHMIYHRFTVEDYEDFHF